MRVSAVRVPACGGAGGGSSSLAAAALLLLLPFASNHPAAAGRGAFPLHLDLLLLLLRRRLGLGAS